MHGLKLYDGVQVRCDLAEAEAAVEDFAEVSAEVNALLREEVAAMARYRRQAGKYAHLKCR